VILTNFDLRTPSYTIELVGLGCNWDLHNFADFEGLDVNTAENRATLRWRVPNVENPWGSFDNAFRGCALVFTGLRALSVTPHDPDHATTEDRDLATVSKVTPEPGPYRRRNQWESGEPFHLLFEFQSGRAIEVAADQAELVGIS
jgi:hypothetical protein